MILSDFSAFISKPEISIYVNLAYIEATMMTIDTIFLVWIKFFCNKRGYDITRSATLSVLDVIEKI